MLGTVQFGMPYGIANNTGQPAYREVLLILETALAGGVNCFDTAAAYGSSEEVLGRALAELNVLDRVLVVTKVRPLTAEENADPAVAAQAIEESVATSRRRLGLDCLPVVLFHREADAAHLDVLETLRQRGWLRHIGVSCDNQPGAATELAASPGVDALQIPASILDRRQRAAAAFRTAAANGTATFVRSILLQGLLVMPEADIPASIAAVIPVRRKLETIANQAGISMLELAARYMLSQEGVTCVLTGVESVEQVRQNIAITEKPPLDADLLRTVDAAVPSLPARILTPALW